MKKAITILVLLVSALRVSAALVSVTVSWNANTDDVYAILYGRGNPPHTQVDAGGAIQDGTMSTTIGGLQPNTTYYFMRIIDHYTNLAVDCCTFTRSTPAPATKYVTTNAPSQAVQLP